MASSSETKQEYGALLFGPQALNFDIHDFQKLRHQLRETPSHRWAIEAVASLPETWCNLIEHIPDFRHLNGQKLLNKLVDGIRDGPIDPSLFPLPNFLLSPLVVIIHLTQYWEFRRSSLPDLADTNVLPPSSTKTLETIGLCTGMLSAFAASSSPSLAKLEQNGATAVRLAMLVGALVDAEDKSVDSHGKSVSFSVSWSGSESDSELKKVLKRYPEAYISVSVDEKRSTITASKKTASSLAKELKLANLRIAGVDLAGRFHWPHHLDNTERLIQFCNSTPVLQLPDASDLFLPSRSDTSGEYVSGGPLHEIALRDILLNKSDWAKSLRTLYSSQSLANNASVVCFGPERCVPPTIARKLGSRLVYLSDTASKASTVPYILDNIGPGALDGDNDGRIAVIGMACHVPGAEDLEGYWDILARGESQHQEVPPERFSIESTWREVDPNRKWYGNFIDGFDAFDHKFFKKSPREMASTDPQHRLSLKLAYQAVEQSGHFQAPGRSKHIGCYMGVGNVDYNRNISCYPANAYSATGNLRSFIAGKVSHYFGWTGPSLTVDTACSSSSVAIHQACRALINGECEAALAGGVNVLTNGEWFHNLAGASFLSPTGQCKPFDARGDGYCRGEGAGVVFLKRLSSAIADGDQVLGVIASTRVYQNQNCTAITVPNAVSLSELFLDVLEQAKLDPGNISVVEAHGTGTPVGDPAEYDGIRRVLGGKIRSDPLYLTSVKGLLGHTEFASGVISLVKTLLMINEGFVPPQASFTSISPSLNAVPEDRIEIPKDIVSWDATFRAALINNYGASGSNASMIVTQAPKRHPSSPGLAPATSYPFWFCGLDDQRLRDYATRFRKFLQNNKASGKDLSVANLSFQVARQSNRSLPHGLIFAAKSTADLDEKLAALGRDGGDAVAAQQFPTRRPVILCFGGQTSTYVGLDKDLYNNVATLRNHLDHCNSICLAQGLDGIYPEIFQRTAIADIETLQIALFATQYSCAKSWIDSGVEPSAVVGHSFGELTALCVSGVISLEDAIKTISSRARLIRDRWGTDRGSMIAVEADLADIERLLAKSNEAVGGGEVLAIACFNGPRSFTVGGPSQAIEAMERTVKDTSEFSKIKLKRLNVTNAFHSILVDPLMDELESLGQDIQFNKPVTPIEHAIEQKDAAKIGPVFFAQHLRNPVFFNQAIQRLHKVYPSAIWLEAGSNSTVTTMVSRALNHPKSSHFQSVNITCDGSFNLLVDTTVKMWREGLNTTFLAHNSSQVSDYTPVLLPPYQFEKFTHWLDLKKPAKFDGSTTKEDPTTEAPKTLTTFLGYQDEAKQTVQFLVNTSLERYQKLTSENFVAGTTAVTPGMLQIEVVLHALISLRPEFQDFTFRPEVSGITYHNPLVSDNSKSTYLEAVSSKKNGLAWDWKLRVVDSLGASTICTTGTTVFRPAADQGFRNTYESLTRIIGKKRLARVLDSSDADEILQGRNIYRAFQRVVDYGKTFRNVAKIAAKDNESAGQVTRIYEADSWIDPVLTESFCQVAGIFVNLMTDVFDVSPGGVFICDKIDRWMRNPSVEGSITASKDWEVFAVNNHESESQFTSDVFAFDSQDGSLAEAILGIRYHRVPMEGLRKGLSRHMTSLTESSTVSDLPAKKDMAVDPNSLTASRVESQMKPEKSGHDKTTDSKPPGPNIPEKAREIICNLAGLEPNEVENDSDLVELGIDSLMAMELVREVEAAFGCTLQNEQLMDLTDFESLTTCIRSTWGLTTTETEHNSSEESRTIKFEPNGAPVHGNGSVSRQEPNGTTGTNGINGINGVNGVNGVNGHQTSQEQEIVLPASTLIKIWRQTKWATDDFVVKGKLAGYSRDVVPRSTELCIAYIVDAFEQLGCSLRSATPGQILDRVPYLPKHERFMKLIYGFLETESRLIELRGSQIVRTAVAVPTSPIQTLLADLIRDEPVHVAEHKLLGMVAPKFAKCLTGEEDGLQLIFGTAEGRQIVTDMYANSPITGIWIQQLEQFLENLVSTFPKGGTQPLRILEMGAGTGGTTCKIVPMLARLGVPIKYTMTDLSSSLVAAARKRFKHYPFMEFKMLDIESEPDSKFLQSQHVILATNCVHATRNLSISLKNIHRMLRNDGFLVLLEMTEKVPWVDVIFGLLEGWWLFEDDRDYVLTSAPHWERILHSVGFGQVDWTKGNLPESSIQRLIIAHASGARFDRESKPPLPAEPANSALTDIAKRKAVIEEYVQKYSHDFQPPQSQNISSSRPQNSGHCVLVTGATGSLGSHIVANLAAMPEISTVVCLNRPSTIEASLRQRKSLEMRGIALDSSTMSKLKVIEADTSKDKLGLSTESYQYLVHNVTHIVHSAWPMSLNRPIRMYHAQFKVMRNLIDLASEIVAKQPEAFQLGFQFISSLAVVGNYPRLTGEALVPEQLMTVESVPDAGYADAKLACEQMLNETLHRHSKRFRPMAVRIAQISGSTTNGYWNPTEYVPFLVRSSQTLKALPALDGTLSWYPVNEVAATLGELLISDTASDLIYHIENPSRQSWKDMIATLARALDISPDGIIPFDSWTAKVREFGGSTQENPALQLIDFFEHYFVSMSCGGLMLETSKTMRHSKTLETSGPVGSELVLRYINAWKQSGFLD